MREVAFCATANPAVDLLERRANPQRIDPQFLQIVELAGQAFQVAAVEGTNLLHAVVMTTIAMVVAWVAVDVTVGQYEIDRGVVPAKRRSAGDLYAFKQQEAVAVIGRAQRDLSLLYRCRLAAVKIAHGAAFREGVGDVQR